MIIFFYLHAEYHMENSVVIEWGAKNSSNQVFLYNSVLFKHEKIRKKLIFAWTRKLH